MRLRVLQAGARDREVSRVRLQLPVDAVELDVREVVLLYCVLELPVDLVDLLQDALRLRALLVDVRIGRRGSHGRQGRDDQKCRSQSDERRCLSRLRPNHVLVNSGTRGNPVGARAVTSRAP